MGGAYGGAFATGLVNSLNQAQDRQINKAYRDALIQQTKSQVKMMEAQEQLKNIELMTKGAAIAEMTGQPFESVMSSMPRPQPVAEQRPQSLLGRIIQGISGGQPPQPQPQPQPPPVPQMIAQAQAQGAIGMGAGPQPAASPEQAARRKDIADKILYGMNPWRERFQAESGQVARTVNTFDKNGNPITVVIDKNNNPIGGYITPVEPYRQKVVTPEGTFEVERPKYGTGTSGGGISQVEPPQMERTKIKTNFGDFEVLQPKYGRPGETTQVAPAGEGMTADRAGKINLIGNALDRVPEIRGLIYPNGQLNRTILAKGKNPLGIPIGEGAILYSKMYQAVEAALRMETGAQANPSEIDTKVKEYWPNAYDTESAIQSKLKDFNSYINGAANIIDPTGDLRKIRETGGVPTGTRQGKPSLNLGKSNITAQQIENDYQQALKKRPDLAQQLKARRDELLQQVK